METKKKKPAKKKSTSARKLCSKVIRREGVKANGQLMKGYKWKPGGGGVAVKVNTKPAAKKKTGLKKPATKRKAHEGINQKTGRLKKGWKYKNGKPVKAATKKKAA